MKRSVRSMCVGVLGTVLVIGMGSVAFAGAKQIIRIGAGGRTVTDLEEGTTTESPIGGTETVQGGDRAEGMAAAEPVRMGGVVLEVTDGSILLDRQFPGGGQEEVIVHIAPEQTLVLDSVDGFPAEVDQIEKGDSLYVYTSPAMTMSLPPQTTAVLVLTDVPQDKAAPSYVRAAEDLKADGQGGWILKGTDGLEIKVPADCPIAPYLTRQIVTLSDITAGRRCLVWTGADGQAEKIVLFNE